MQCDRKSSGMLCDVMGTGNIYMVHACGVGDRAEGKSSCILQHDSILASPHRSSSNLLLSK